MILLAVLDTFIAISEDLNLKFFRGTCPRTPLVCSRLRVCIRIRIALHNAINAY